MPYQEFWMPIQNAIQSVNQNINTIADREDRRAAMGLQSIMQMDQLRGNQLERQLAQGASDRAERQFQLQKAGQTFDQRMKEAENARQAEVARLQAPVLKQQAAIAEQALVPRDVNLFSLIGGGDTTREWAFDRTSAASQMAEIIGGKNAAFDKDGFLYDKNTNKRIRKTNIQLMDSLPLAMGVATSFNDPLDNQANDIKKQEAHVESLRENMNKFKKDQKGVFLKQAAEASYNLQMAEKKLDSMRREKPWAAIKQYESRQRILETLAANYAHMGGRPEAITTMLTAAKENSDILQTLRKQKYEFLTQGTNGQPVLKTIYREGKDGKVLETRQIAVPKLNKAMTPYDVDETLTSQQNEGEVWKWDDTADLAVKLDKNGQIDGTWLGFFKEGKNRFGKYDLKGQFIVTPGLEKQSDRYDRLFQELSKQEGMSPLDVTVAAKERVLQDEREYWNLYDDFDKYLSTNTAPYVDPADGKTKLRQMSAAEAEQMRKNKQDFIKAWSTDTGYVPDVSSKPLVFN